MALAANQCKGVVTNYLGLLEDMLKGIHKYTHEKCAGKLTLLDTPVKIEEIPLSLREPKKWARRVETGNPKELSHPALHYVFRVSPLPILASGTSIRPVHNTASILQSLPPKVT